MIWDRCGRERTASPARQTEGHFPCGSPERFNGKIRAYSDRAPVSSFAAGLINRPSSRRIIRGYLRTRAWAIAREISGSTAVHPPRENTKMSKETGSRSLPPASIRVPRSRQRLRRRCQLHSLPRTPDSIAPPTGPIPTAGSTIVC